MIRYLSVEQITNAAWLLMISAALVLGARVSLTRLAMYAITVQKVEHVGSLSKLMK